MRTAAWGLAGAAAGAVGAVVALTITTAQPRRGRHRAKRAGVFMAVGSDTKRGKAWLN